MYCKNHFKFLTNAVFVDQADVIEQFVLGTLCDDYVISNSTFSWWQAWLGEQQKTKIIRPVQNYRGTYRVMNNDKDYFPDRWIIFNPNLYRIDLKYSQLIIKGEILKLMDLIKHYRKLTLKKTKKIIKKIIIINIFNS